MTGAHSGNSLDLETLVRTTTDMPSDHSTFPRDRPPATGKDTPQESVDDCSGAPGLRLP